MRENEENLLRRLLDSAERRMEVSLKQQLIPHPGELGTAREEIIRRFLAQHLPGAYGISTGHVFDSAQSISHQIDIVIYDRRSCPPLEAEGGKRLFPVESVLAVGQVKSSMKSRRVFDECWQNIASVKCLDRSAEGESRDYWTGEPLDHRNKYLHQVFGFTFVTGRCLSGESLVNYIYEAALQTERHVWTNVVFAFGQRLATFACPDGICANAMHARGIGIYEYDSSAGALLTEFYKMLARALDVTRFACPPYGRHLRGVNKRSGTIHGPFRFGPPWPDDGCGLLGQDEDD